MIVTVAVLELDSRFALIDKINFPSFSPFCVLGIHHCLLLVTVHEELHVISIVSDSPLALMLSNFDSDIFNVAESESSHPINIHNNGRRKINFVFINERVLYKNARFKDNVLIWNRIAYFSKYSTSLNIYPLLISFSSSNINLPSGSTQTIRARNSPLASLYRCIPSLLKRDFSY